MSNPFSLRPFLLFVLCLLFVAPLQAQDAPESPNVPLVVFLVRHAEKNAADSDPELTAAGQKRAHLLSSLLSDAGIQHVHSSDFKRTRATAEPLARERGLAVELYDPRKLKALVETLKSQGGRHLIVGHSNTTPNVVKLLGGKPGSPINEPAEYDRLYIVTAHPGSDAATMLLRYGSRYRTETDEH